MKTRRLKGKSFALLTKQEFAALSACARVLAQAHGEDVQGVILKFTGRWLLNDVDLVRLADAVEHAKLPGPVARLLEESP